MAQIISLTAEKISVVTHSQRVVEQKVARYGAICACH